MADAQHPVLMWGLSDVVDSQATPSQLHDQATADCPQLRNCAGVLAFEWLASLPSPLKTLSDAAVRVNARLRIGEFHLPALEFDGNVCADVAPAAVHTPFCFEPSERLWLRSTT